MTKSTMQPSCMASWTMVHKHSHFNPTQPTYMRTAVVCMFTLYVPSACASKLADDLLDAHSLQTRTHSPDSCIISGSHVNWHSLHVAMLLVSSIKQPCCGYTPQQGLYKIFMIERALDSGGKSLRIPQKEVHMPSQHVQPS